MDQASVADLDKARAEGREVGLDPDGLGGTCPYPHRFADLRLAWFDGFSEGRTQLEMQHGPVKRTPDDPGQ